MYCDRPLDEILIGIAIRIRKARDTEAPILLCEMDVQNIRNAADELKMLRERVRILEGGTQ